MDDKKTHELDNIINFVENEQQLKEYLTKTISESVNIDFTNYLETLIEKKNLSKANLIKAAGLDRNYGYQILSGKKNASRDKILRLCIAGNLTLEETNRLLSLGSYPRLYSKDRRDSIITFALNKCMSTIDVDLLLDKYNQIPLD